MPTTHSCRRTETLSTKWPTWIVNQLSLIRNIIALLSSVVCLSNELIIVRVFLSVFIVGLVTGLASRWYSLSRLDTSPARQMTTNHHPHRVNNLIRTSQLKALETSSILQRSYWISWWPAYPLQKSSNNFHKKKIVKKQSKFGILIVLKAIFK